MSLAVVYSRACAGIEAPAVTIEVHLSNGLPGLSIVGMPETAVKESRHRVRSALMNSGFKFPVRRITVNLAPADLPKEGGRFDLPIALGILAASEQIPAQPLADYEFVGELALSGELRPCLGALPFAMAARRASRRLLVPIKNLHEAALVDNGFVYGAQHLLEVCAHFTGHQELLVAQQNEAACFRAEHDRDLSEVQGQAHGRRALEVAAAGRHSLLMVGPPGAGKTLLASCLPGILPEMDEAEALEVAAIYSTSRQGFDLHRWRRRPFRTPHHSASMPALVGGGNPPQPGEISLAHRGVLFLDELPEFNRVALEALREPLESGSISISRAAHQSDFPANFQMIAAMNPCPCGYQGSHGERCRCTSEQVQKYQQKISGPLFDRIDMHMTICALPAHCLMRRSAADGESSIHVRERVTACFELQKRRQGKQNALLSAEDLWTHCELDEDNQQLLTQAVDTLGLSARSCHRVLRVARTIADLADSQHIQAPHLQEAISYRPVI